MNIRSTIVIGAATAGFVGKIPVAPGTFGSMLGVLIYYGMTFIPVFAAFFLITGFILFSMWIAGEAEKLLGGKAPGCIVIDEVAGMAVTFFALPMTMPVGVLGFLLFRFFDILKPFPIRFLEQKIPGGAGVVIDDVVAGVMSNILLRIIIAAL